MSRLDQVNKEIKLLEKEKERLLKEAKKAVSVGPFIDLTYEVGKCCRIYWRYLNKDMFISVDEVRAMGERMIEFADNLS